MTAELGRSVRQFLRMSTRIFKLYFENIFNRNTWEGEVVSFECQKPSQFCGGYGSRSFIYKNDTENGIKIGKMIRGM